MILSIKNKFQISLNFKINFWENVIVVFFKIQIQIQGILNKANFAEIINLYIVAFTFCINTYK